MPCPNKAFLIACFVLARASVAFGAAGGELPSRSDVPEQYKWRLSDIYASDAAWEDDYTIAQNELPKLAERKGTLGKSAASLLECLRINDEISIRLGKIYVYANMKSHEDTANPTYRAMADKASTLLVETNATGSFITPEILEIPEETLLGFIDPAKTGAGFDDYRFMIKEIIRRKTHVLTPSEEALLAKAGNMAGTPDEVFSMLTNADMKFPYIKDENGKKVELTEERYYKYISSSKRRVRKAAFKGLFDTYAKNNNTLGATFNGMLKASRFYANARKYESDLEASLDGPNIPAEVYVNLVSAVENNLEPLHRYMELRKKVLGLDKLHLYDIYNPLVENPYKDIPWKTAKEIAAEALRPLGAEYMKQFGEGLESGWIDVYSNRGKRGGAYSWGTYGTHPYILLNYNGELSDVMTLVHEMGHSMHSFYSRKAQPYPMSDYTTFCAEVASTANEELALEHLLRETTDKKKKIYLLNQRLERIRATVYRQVMFASFESDVHRRFQENLNTTADELGKMWLALNKKYFGSDVTIDERIALEWSRIPHFYSPFYVYQYATGYAAAASLARQILSEGEPARARYLEFLSSGGSDYPIELLKRAGVDMSGAQPIEDVIKLFSSTLDEMEKLLKETGALK